LSNFAISVSLFRNLCFIYLFVCLFVYLLANTGAGKSTLLNALLGEAELLPTNAMRACTASIIQIEHNAQQRPGAEYTAHIEFLSHAEWEAEVKAAFALVSERAKVAQVAVGAAPPEDTPAHEAWDKLRQNNSKVLSIVTLCSDYTRALTFEIFFLCQRGLRQSNGMDQRRCPPRAPIARAIRSLLTL
jgi:predicted kinase